MNSVRGGILSCAIVLCGFTAAAQQTPATTAATPTPAAVSNAAATTPASAPAATGTGLDRTDPFVVVASVARPMVTKRMSLTYPPDAIAQNITGVVKLEFLVSREGKVIAVRKVSGPELLADAAAKGLVHAEYQPMTLDGKPVYMASTIRIEFTLDTTKTPPVPGARELVGPQEDAQDAAMISADRPFARHDPSVPLDEQRKAILAQVTWNVTAASLIHRVEPVYLDSLKREGV